MSTGNPSLTPDPLFVGATRPPMRWGVTYAALLFNLVFTMEVFLLTKNLLTMLCCIPVHGLFALLCSRDARFFDLLLLWGRTRLPAAFGNLRHWRASSYSPLVIDVASVGGYRRYRVLGAVVCAVRPITARSAMSFPARADEPLTGTPHAANT